MIASGSGDKTVKLWNAASGQELRTLIGHSSPVLSVAFSPDSRTVASGSGDATIKLWDTESGRELRTLAGRASPVLSVVFSPDGRLMASGSEDGTVRLWDVANGQELRELRGHAGAVHSVVFSPDSRVIASGSGDTTIELWDAANGRALRALHGHVDAVYSVAFSPDGRTIASGSGDKTVKLWDAASGRELRTLIGHAGRVWSAAFSPDGRTIASGSEDTTIKLWDVQSGQLVPTLQKYSDEVMSVSFLSNRIVAAGHYSRITLWDVPEFINTPTTNPPEQIEKAPPPVAAIPVPAASASPVSIAPAMPERRVALVIGNSAYRKVGLLPNPSRDADLVGAALQSAGVDVTIAHDLDRDSMVKALRAFSKKAEGADWAVIYYAGHGIEIGGTNYLIPIDAKLETDSDVPDEAIPLEQLQSRLAGARRLKLIVLDACRNNPFASQMKMTVTHRSISRGFTRFEPAVATLVVYAAKDGTTAVDGDGADSPFAISFAKRVVERGVEINKVFRFVTQDVLVTTGHQQQPFVYGSLPADDFYFVPPK
jgi:Caspase domain/WD domain, G-beta repeat